MRTFTDLLHFIAPNVKLILNLTLKSKLNPLATLWKITKTRQVVKFQTSLQFTKFANLTHSESSWFCNMYLTCLLLTRAKLLQKDFNFKKYPQFKNYNTHPTPQKNCPHCPHFTKCPHILKMSSHSKCVLTFATTHSPFKMSRITKNVYLKKLPLSKYNLTSKIANKSFFLKLFQLSKTS